VSHAHSRLCGCYRSPGCEYDGTRILAPEHLADMLLHILDPLLMMIPLLLVCMPSEHRLEKLYLALDLWILKTPTLPQL